MCEAVNDGLRVNKEKFGNKWERLKYLKRVMQVDLPLLEPDMGRDSDWRWLSW